MRPATATEPAALAYVTKRSAAVRWLADPSYGVQTPATIGAAAGQSPAGVAVLDDHVYVAEGSGVTRLPVAGRAGTAAVEVPGTAGLASSALAADPARHRLYVGTSVPELTDDVVVLDTASGAVETYDSGFTGVTGLGVEPDGDLLVTDDPGLAAGNIDSLNQGRLFRVPLAPLRRSRTTITAAPDAWSASASVTFAYSSSASDAAFECRLDRGAWTACDATITFDGLDEGWREFEVRALTDAGPGLSARRVFVLDRTAPAVVVASPGATVQRGTGRIDLVATENAVRFTCAIDGATPSPCEPGQALPDLEPGEHTLHVTATDAAGNVSDPGTTRTFTVTAPKPVPTPTPAPTTTPAPKPASTPAPGRRPRRPRPPGQARHHRRRDAGRRGPRPGGELHAARRAPARHPEPGRGPLQGLRTVKVSFIAGGQAETARVAILAGRSKHKLIVREVELGPDGEQLVTLRLSHRERLRPGLYRVTVTVRGPSGESNRGDHRLRVRP